MFRGNIFTNIKSCIKCDRDKQVKETVRYFAIFDNNTFIDVDKLNHDANHTLCQGKLHGNNTFDNCGIELT